MKIIGITRIRNEEDIILLTLDHVSALVDEIVVYDDCSTDTTVELCKSHPFVSCVIEGKTWASDPKGRNRAEGLRQVAYVEAVKRGADFVYCFDADEYAIFDLDFTADVYRLRLFDYYITPADIDSHFLTRKFLGPEYRDIAMIFRVVPGLNFRQREPINTGKVTKIGGYVKHYGKAISVEEWEKTCDYYINHRGGSYRTFFTNKWKARKGKAVHTKSDYGAALIRWEEREEKGFKNTH